MLVPEHQDWHNNIEEYFDAKKRLFTQQAGNDLTIYNANNPTSKKVASISNAKKIPYIVPDENLTNFEHEGIYVNNDTIFAKDQPVCNTSDVALLGTLNLENVCAAIAATWDIIEQYSDVITKVVKDLKA